MYDPVPFTHIPVITEPDAQARFREELATQRDPAPFGPTEVLTVPADPDLLRAGHIARLGRLVRFS